MSFKDHADGKCSVKYSVLLGSGHNHLKQKETVILEFLSSLRPHIFNICSSNSNEAIYLYSSIYTASRSHISNSWSVN